MSKRIPAETVKKIVQMYRDGEKLEYIAELCNVSMGAICRFAKEAGLARVPHKPRKPRVAA